MNIFAKSTILAALLAGTCTIAAADAHADPLTVTCAEFEAMEISDQESFLTALASAMDEADNEELDIGSVQVLCNGSEEEPVSEQFED
ncbi:hypothetical protein [Yoonia sp. 2307UL14-13]|uniref:hypothetical protein n=1 Tax=Yoonia sp. 2307UL14-13 TaxID=3126506 RepID=UPI0030A63FF1